MITNQLKDIISDIKKETCVLIIGPDIIDFGDKTFFETMSEKLITNDGYQNVIDAAPPYVFTNEELLQLMPAAKETTLLRMMEAFYHAQTAFDQPLTQISQIPFHLIVSLMPDDRLQKLFESQNLVYNYSHYPREGSHSPVQKPSREIPLLYNLLGDFNELDAIITFDHLFTFLSGIMGKRELPQTIQETLKKARTFIFLGVHFEKWYVQLLLRIITSNDKKDKYTVLKNRENNEVCTFIARRLELDFLKVEPLPFLDLLYRECGNQGILKTANIKFKAKIFVSYSSRDIEIVRRIEKRLGEAHIEVFRDEISSHPGQKIDNFIKTIQNVDGVFFVVSENSLASPWVSKEIIQTLQANKLFIPCYVDRSFLDYQFWEKLNQHITAKSLDIGNKIIARGVNSIDDLLLERSDWLNLKLSIPKIKEELNRGICKSIMEGDFEQNMDQAINYILTHK